MTWRMEAYKFWEEGILDLPGKLEYEFCNCKDIPYGRLRLETNETPEFE